MTKEYAVIILWLLLANFLLAQNKTAGFSMQLPEIPPMIVADVERQNYFISHFWDHCNFENKTLLNYKTDLQRYFQQYVFVFSSYPNRKNFSPMVNQTLLHLKNADTSVIRYFTSLYENYFYNPLSNSRDDDIYIPVLQFLTSSPKFTEVEKTTWKYRLNMASKNKIGTTATLFNYQLPNGTTQSLSAIKSEYTILFFYNPECSQCQVIQKAIETSDPLLNAINNNQLTILAIYTELDYNGWIKHIKPQKGWIYGYDAKQIIQTKALYDLKAMPTLYLLDKTKRILLKDTDVKKIVNYSQQR